MFSAELCFSFGAPRPKIPVENKPVESKPAPTVVVPGGTETTVSETVKTPTETIKVETLPGQQAIGSDYSVKSTLSWLAEVGKVANCVVKQPDFIKEVSEHKQFDYTSDSSKTVAEKMAKFTPVILTTYTKNCSSAIAYRNVGSNIVYFNLGKNCKLQRLNPRAMKYMINTAIHERLHVVGYGHGDNNSKGKGNSVPYGVGDLAEKYADRCKALVSQEQ